MGKNVYNTSWGNLSTKGLGATVRSGNISRDTGLNFPATGEFILGCLMTQKTAAIEVSANNAAADHQSFISALLDVNSIKADVEEGVVKNYEDGNAFTMVSDGLIYAAFNVDQIDFANKLLYTDVNGVFGLYASDPGAGFVLVNRASPVSLPTADYNSVETTGIALVFNTVTYTNGITYRLIKKW